MISEPVSESQHSLVSLPNEEIPFWKRLLPRRNRDESDNQVAPVDRLRVSVSRKRKIFRAIRNLLAAGIFLTASDIQTGVISEARPPIEENLPESNTLEEVNIIQRLLKFSELYAKVRENPDDLVAHNTFVAWLKFNGAVQYAAQVGYPIASEMALHFLYGEGKDLDISNLFLENIQQLYKNIFSNELEAMGLPEKPSDIEALKIIIQQVFAEKPTVMATHSLWSEDGLQHMGYGGGIYALSSEGTYIIGEPSQDLVGQSIKFFSIAILGEESSLFGLGSFTVSVEGKVISVDGGLITLENPIIKFRDVYDWDKTGLKASTSFETVLSQFGLSPEMSANFSEVFGLDNVDLSISDDEGKLLTQQHAASPYAVVAKFLLPGPFKIDNTQLLPPPNKPS